jgi:hypothetical protein
MIIPITLVTIIFTNILSKCIFPKLEQYTHDPFNMSRLFGILLVIKYFVTFKIGWFMDHGLDCGTITMKWFAGTKNKLSSICTQE